MHLTRFEPVAAALALVRGRLERACARAGREPGSVRLVAVTKTVSAERINTLIEAGHVLLGENKVQEALDKRPAVRAEARWHFIGHLQRNKARLVAGQFDLVHSVDSEALALELDRRAAAMGLVQPVLVQVNLGGEATKSGVDEAGALPLLERIAAQEHLALAGLMTIPPPADDPEASRGPFRALRGLRDRAALRLGRPLPELSMGMTDDFEVAIEEGATLVRVGRALFGERG